MINRFKHVKTEIKNNKKFLSYLGIFLQFDKRTEEKIDKCEPAHYPLHVSDLTESVLKDNRDYPLVRYDYEFDEEGLVTWIKLVTEKKIIKCFKIDDNEWVVKNYYFSKEQDFNQLSLDLK